MLLTISADDFGLHPEIDAGILDLIERGVVGATSVLIPSPNLDPEKVLIAKQAGVSLGVHLTFTEMSPISPDLKLSSPWLTQSGAFRSHWTDLRMPLLTNRLPQEQIEIEWNAQIAKFTELFGAPDFLDSHQNLHLIWPFTKVANTVLRKNKISKLRVFYDKLRIQHVLTSTVCLAGKILIEKQAHLPTYGLFDSGRLTLETLTQVVTHGRKRHDHIVVATHPGSTNSLSMTPKHNPNYTLQWLKEYDLLTSNEFRHFLNREGIKLTCLNGSIL